MAYAGRALAVREGMNGAPNLIQICQEKVRRDDGSLEYRMAKAILHLDRALRELDRRLIKSGAPDNLLVDLVVALRSKL